MTHPSIPASAVVSADIDDHVATVWLDRAEARNAFAPEFWRDFPAVIEAVAADPRTRVIIVAARGDAFTVGIDLKAFGPILMSGGVDPDDPSPPGSEVGRRRAMYERIRAMQHTFSAIADCPQPVIAAVHGYCIGAGVDLITACDMRFASADAVFSVRETKLAMVADVGTLQRLPGIVDPGWLADVVYTGRDFDAAEALDRGLVSKVAADPDGVLELARAVAGDIAANSPLAVQGAKAVLRAGEGRDVTQHLDYVALWNAAFIHSNDFTEAAMAFLQKRPPEFTGE
ncbi:MAG: enoyl-CoA hydratase-related protein [Acidimicrobiia bacterium]|nr:enoyl-CoA hydratase-related protein [Acidimicrobiia bacterium]